MTTTESQSERVTGVSPAEEEVKIGLQSLAELENVTEATPATSGALEPKAKLAFEVLELAMLKYCSVRDTSITDL